MQRIHSPSRLTLAMIGLTVVGALTLPISVEGDLLDDFNDGDDVGWTRFTLPPDLPGASWDASTGVYRLSVEESTPQNGTVASFLDITDDPSFYNGYWWATVVRETENSTSHLFMRGQFAAKNAYAFGWRPDLGLLIQRVDGGSSNLLANDDTFVQDVGTQYILEAGAFTAESGANDLELRMWPVGDDRPEFPQLEATDSTYSWGANGIAAQAFSDGDLSVTYDDVSFVPEPATLALVVLGGLLIASRRRLPSP